MIQDLVLRLKGAVDSAAQAMPGLLSRVGKAAKVATGVLLAAGLALRAYGLYAAGAVGNVLRLAESLENLRLSLVMARRVTVLTIALTGLAGALVGAADAATHYIVEQRRMAEGLGVSLQTMQRLSIATAAYGLNAEGLTNVLGTLADRAQQVREGNEGTIKDFKAMGVTVADLKGKNPAELFRVLAARLKETGPTTASTSAAFRVLGGDAAKLLPLLRRGTQEIDKIGDAAARMGVLIGKDAARSAEEYGVEVEELRVQMRALGAVLAIAAVPAARKLVAEFRDFVRLYAPTAIDRTRKAADGLTFALEHLLGPLRDLARILLLGAIGNSLRSLYIVMGSLSGAIPMLVRGLYMLRGAFFALYASMPAVLGPIVAIGLAVDDLLAFMNGGPSIIGDVVQAFRDLGAWLMQQEGVPELLTALQDVSAVMAYLGGVVVGELIGHLSRLYDALYPIWSVFAELAGFTFKNLGEFVSIVAKMFGGAIGAGVAGAGAAVSGDAQSRAAAEAAASGVLGPLGGAGVRALAAGASGVRGNNLGGVLAAAQRGVAVGQQGRAAVRQDIAINVTGVTGDQVAQQIARQLDTTFAAAAAAGG